MEVFRFAPSADELTRAESERERMHGIERMVLNIYRYIRDNFDGEDRVQVEIESLDLNLGNVTTALVTVRRADPFYILDRMEYVIQSNQAVKIDSGDFRIRVTHVPAMRGAGYSNQRAKILEHFTTVTQEVLSKTKAIHAIDRDLHPFCGVAALILGKALVDSKGTLLTRAGLNRWRKKNSKKTLRKECYSVIRKQKIGNISKGISLNQLSSLAHSRLFEQYKIIVYSTKNFNLPIAIENKVLGWRESILLLLDDTCHFSIITKPNAFLGRKVIIVSLVTNFLQVLLSVIFAMLAYVNSASRLFAVSLKNLKSFSAGNANVLFTEKFVTCDISKSIHRLC